MKVFRVCLLALLVLGVVPRSDAQCTTTLGQALAATPQLSQLNAVVGLAGLSSFLDDPTLNVTVFAPNNNAMTAFVNLLNQSDLTVSNVTSPSNNVAASIIRYHVLPVPATSAQLVDGQVAPTLLSGYNVTIQKNATTVVVQGVESDATVVQADIPVCRSYVHIIDDVLLPAELKDIPAATPPPPGTPPTPPGTVTPPPPGPNNAPMKLGSISSLLTGAAAAVVAAVFAAL